MQLASDGTAIQPVSFRRNKKAYSHFIHATYKTLYTDVISCPWYGTQYIYYLLKHTAKL